MATPRWPRRRARAGRLRLRPAALANQFADSARIIGSMRPEPTHRQCLDERRGGTNRRRSPWPPRSTRFSRSANRRGETPRSHQEKITYPREAPARLVRPAAPETTSRSRRSVAPCLARLVAPRPADPVLEPVAHSRISGDPSERAGGSTAGTPLTRWGWRPQIPSTSHGSRTKEFPRLEWDSSGFSSGWYFGGLPR
jgi:hypothetical protein